MVGHVKQLRSAVANMFIIARYCSCVTKWANRSATGPRYAFPSVSYVPLPFTAAGISLAEAGDRDGKPESTAAVDRALDADRAAVFLDDPLDDRQSQPGARAAEILRRVSAEERLEDVRDILRADAD